MIALIKKIALDFCYQKQRKEILEFLEVLEAMDPKELAPLAISAAHFRNSLEKILLKNMDHIDFEVMNDPLLPSAISQTIQRMQKKGLLSEAAGGMIWLHTARACEEVRLRPSARKMWQTLEKGFKFGPAAIDLLHTMQQRYDYKNYESIPFCMRAPEAK